MKGGWGRGTEVRGEKEVVGSGPGRAESLTQSLPETRAGLIAIRGDLREKPPLAPACFPLRFVGAWRDSRRADERDLQVLSPSDPCQSALVPSTPHLAVPPRAQTGVDPSEPVF